MLSEIIKIALSNFLHVPDLLGLVLLNVVELLRVIQIFISCFAGEVPNLH